MHDTIGIHYPSKDAKPAGVWWLDEATGTVQRYPLASRRREPLARCFAQDGYTQRTSYWPASRLWPIQWIEGG